MTATIDSELESQLIWVHEMTDQLVEGQGGRAVTVQAGSWSKAGEIIAVLLFLYDRIGLWNERAGDQATDEEAQRMYRQWHDEAVRVYAVAKASAADGYSLNLLDRFRDAIGFCPYIGVSASDILRAQADYDQGKYVSSAKVRDDIQHRLLHRGDAKNR